MTTQDAARHRYYGEIAQHSMYPLWEVLSGMVTTTPKTPCLPHVWKWAASRAALMQAGDLISAKEAERRVLILENPGLKGRTRITHSLYAGLQLIMPGEVAPAHRHTQSALRFVLEGTGAYTAVDGERVMMNVGDFIITPSWTFHDHGHLSSEPVIWLDGLDVPIVELFDAQFMEKGADDSQETLVESNTNLAEFGFAMKPVGFRPRAKTSPLFWYPYERSREALETLRRAGPMHPCWGHKLQYTNPVTGGWAMPTIATFMQLLPSGFSGRRYRSTDSTIYVVVEGTGRCVVGDTVLNFGPKDVFVCPSWMPYRFEVDAGPDAVLFSYSDRAAQEAMDLWREQADAGAG